MRVFAFVNLICEYMLFLYSFGHLSQSSDYCNTLKIKSLGEGSECCTSVEISSTKSRLISCRSFTLSLCTTALIL